MIKSIIDIFKQTVKNSPEKTAVEDSRGSCSFYELNHLVHQISTAVLKLQLKNKNIMIFLEKDRKLIASDLAVCLSKNVFINLDISNPPDRLQKICSQTEAALCISERKYADKIQKFNPTCAVLFLEELPEIKETEADLPPAYEGSDADPFCIINTSGSTGTPKSVILSHRGFISFFEAAHQISPFSQERIGSLAPAFFDHFIFELFLMAAGSTLVCCLAAHAMFPPKVVDFLAQRKISFIFWVPTVMVNIAAMDLLKDIKLPDLKIVWFAGEIFKTARFNYWKSKLPHAQFVNLYGPIETTIDCAYYEVPGLMDENKPIPIGQAFPNKELLLLDEQNQLSRQGEICVRGCGLAFGYYNAPELTAKAFVQNPLHSSYPDRIYRTGDFGHIDANGQLVFQGRKDNMIKIHGYRVELEEIENTILASVGALRDCCCIYNPQAEELILFYAAAQELTLKDFASQLKGKIVHYMFPRKFIFMPNLPMNPNGKINRKALLSQSLQQSNHAK